MRAVLIAAILLLVQGAPQSEVRGTISGQVIGSDGTPQRDVLVTALERAEFSSSADSPVSSTRTDREGRYVLERLHIGSYYIMAGGAESPVYFHGNQGAYAKALTVGPGDPTITGIDFLNYGAPPKRPTGAIAGRIVSGDGNPAVDVQVSAIWSTMLIASARTDRDGRYILERVPTTHADIYIQVGAGRMAVYYPSTTREGAETVMVRAGETLNGIDVRLGYGAVAGRLSFANGRAAASVKVSAIPKQNPSQTQARCSGRPVTAVTSDADGRYRLEDLPPGSYHIAGGSEGALVCFQAGLTISPVIVKAGAAIDGIDIRIPQSVAETWEVMEMLKEMPKGR